MTFHSKGGSFSQSTASNKAAQSRRGGSGVISARRDAPRDVKRAGDSRRAARSTNLTSLKSLTAIQGKSGSAARGASGVISARRDGPQITDARPDLAPGQQPERPTPLMVIPGQDRNLPPGVAPLPTPMMGGTAARWTTPDGVNIMDKAHDAAGPDLVPPGPPVNVGTGGLDFNAPIRGKIRKGGYKQGQMDPRELARITRATRQAQEQWTEPGSPERLAQGQAIIDETSYTPRESARIRQKQGEAANAYKYDEDATTPAQDRLDPVFSSDDVPGMHRFFSESEQR